MMRNDDNTATTLDTMETESFVNVEAIDDDALSFSVLSQHKVIGVDNDLSSSHFCVNMQARDIPDDDSKRSPVDITVALDISGSMSGPKLHLCKQTLEMMLRVLRKEDRFSLVTYHTTAQIEIPLQQMTEKNKQSALLKIKALRSKNSTNISAAIGLAAQELRSVENPNEIRTIFLLTDGFANCGISDLHGLVELTKNCLAGDAGNEYQKTYMELDEDKKPSAIETKPTPPISLHTFGYGEGHNSQLLREMASATEGGSYYFVENDTQVDAAFGDALGGILSTVAQNAVLTIKVPAESSAMGVKISKVFHEQAIERDNGTYYTVTVGDFYAEESRDVVLEVQLAKPSDTSSMAPIHHINVSMAYTDTMERRPVLTKTVNGSIVRPSGNEVSEEDAHVAAQLLRVFTVQKMKEAEKFVQQNNFADAMGSMASASAFVGRAAPHVQAQAFYAELAADVRDTEMDLQYQRSTAGHNISSKFRAHQTQRASAADAGASSTYRKKAKVEMARKFKTMK